MAWVQTLTVTLSDQWQHSLVVPSSATYFRITHLNVSYTNLPFLIGQSQLLSGDDFEFFDVRRYFHQEGRIIVVFPQPEFFNQRRLCLKGLAVSGWRISNWGVNIDRWIP